jgi:hypothetical protein
MRLQRPSEGSGILTPDHMPTLVPLQFARGHAAAFSFFT